MCWKFFTYLSKYGRVNQFPTLFKWDSNMAQVRRVVLVLSGKGGVGKSTITTELALALRHAGKKVSCVLMPGQRFQPSNISGKYQRSAILCLICVHWVQCWQIQCDCYSTCCRCVPQVGILDVDLCGPSIPRMLSIAHTDVHQCDSGWVPVYTDAQKTLAIMSIGFLLEDPDEAVVWRGPKKTGMLFSQWKHSWHYPVGLPIVFSIRFPFLHTQQLWLASLCQMLHGGSWMCCWWTHHQEHLTNIWQCWRTWRSTAG